MSTLARYEEIARTMTDGALLYAIRDVSETLDIWKREPETDYTRKLWAEFDAYTVEIAARRAGKRTRPRG